MATVGTTTKSVMRAKLDQPTETRTFPKGKIEVVKLGDSTVGRYTFQPGWRWEDSVKPLVKTEHCENHHVGYAQSGRMHIRSTDGTETEIVAGEAYDIMPGHDAWVAGQETFVGLEFKSAAEYARPKR